MEFINLREEALKVLEIGKCSSSTVKVIRRGAVVYLYKHAAIFNSSSIGRKNGDAEALTDYINEHPHISKIIFPNYTVSNLFIYKLKLAGFFEKLNRKVRIIAIWDYRVKMTDTVRYIVEENNIRLYNFTNRPLSYLIKGPDTASIYCKFIPELVGNAIFPVAALSYNIV